MAARKGTSAIWLLENASVTSITQPGGAVITLTGTVFNFQSVSGSKKAEKGMLKNGAGTVTGVAYCGVTREVSIDVIPSGNTLTLAKQGNVLPKHGAIVVLADSDDANLNGNWICEDSDWKRSNDPNAPLMITMKLFNGETDISPDMNAA